MPSALYQLHFYTDAPEVLVEHGHDHECLPFFLVTLSHSPAGAFLQQRTLRQHEKAQTYNFIDAIIACANGKNRDKSDECNPEQISYLPFLAAV